MQTPSIRRAGMDPTTASRFAASSAGNGMAKQVCADIPFGKFISEPRSERMSPFRSAPEIDLLESR